MGKKVVALITDMDQRSAAPPATPTK